jgi:hypothetical protein
MFQVRELSIKLTGSDEARGPLLACVVCDSTAESACPTPSAVPLFACNVCNSTPEQTCGSPSFAPLFNCTGTDTTCAELSGAYALENERGGLQLLREQLSHHLAQLN